MTDCVVGAALAADVATWMWFSLSPNVVAVPAVLRAQPSGTFTEKPPPAGWKATYAWLSGMSPGGFDSVATGFEGAVDAEPGALGDWVVPVDGVLGWDDGAVDGADPAELELLHPLANPVSAATASGTTVSCLIFMKLSPGRGHQLSRR
ncbi:MAG TPA: hypothetical protein VGD34_23745 [Kribbella sp.]